MIYLDYNATSPIHPEVSSAMAPFWGEAFGNPSSLHAKGRQAREAVESVRVRVLKALGDPKGQLVFTSGGTEANNFALKGVIGALGDGAGQLIVSAVEHEAVLQVADVLRREGVHVSVISVDSHGVVDLEVLRAAITPQTALISVMHANNEIGTLQPLEEIGRMARARGILFHTDAVQSFGKLSLNVQEIGVDMVSISAHKLGGPKGVGALYLRQGVEIQPLLHGGPHEHNLRGGTEGVAGIVGLGAALEVSLKEREADVLSRIEGLRDRLETGLRESVPDLEVNGHPSERLPGTLNVSFLGCPSEALLTALDLADICVSAGAACSSGSTEPSHVLTAMNLPLSQVRSAIRFSLGWGTTEREIDECLQRIPPIVQRIRQARAEVSS